MTVEIRHATAADVHSEDADIALKLQDINYKYTVRRGRILASIKELRSRMNAPDLFEGEREAYETAMQLDITTLRQLNQREKKECELLLQGEGSSKTVNKKLDGIEEEEEEVATVELSADSKEELQV